MIHRFFMWLSVLGLTVGVLIGPAFAFEPMPPIMQTLLQVFPEVEGRFVDEPFGAVPEMPEEARPLFETFRVIVPTPDDIEKNLARLYAASSELPIKKITRYDKDPGAPSLAGFRGVWCETEDEDQVGFSILTINQNRFLIWAKMGYYPFFANDSISPKVRDQYARDVSQYLAGIDMKVPDNEAPQASGRGLPEGMELYHQIPVGSREQGFSGNQYVITAWGHRDVGEFIPTLNEFKRFADEVLDTLWEPQGLKWLQAYYRDVSCTYRVQSLFPASTTITITARYVFGVDRYGRIRYAVSVPFPPCSGYPDSLKNECSAPTTAILFPTARLFTAGFFQSRCDGAFGAVTDISIGNGNAYAPYMAKSNANESATPLDTFLESFGHFFKLLLDERSGYWLGGQTMRIRKL